MKFWPRYVGDFKKKTASLTLLEKAVYTELLDYYYANEEPIPLEPARIMAIVGARTAAEHSAVGTVLGKFFVKNGSGWENLRAKEEIAKWRDKSQKATRSVNKRWGKG